MSAKAADLLASAASTSALEPCVPESIAPRSSAEASRALERRPQPAEPSPCSAVAFEVTVYEMSCVAFAKNAAQARWLAVKGWRNAGMGGRREWPNVSARRAPQFDKFPLRDSRPGQCWTPDYVRQCC